MKMVRSLLLGSAAGLVAVAGAQAADLPVKAKPVQYVKICDLYGAGFYYIPGTDTCLKIGGYLRVQLDIHAGGGGIVDGSGNPWGRKDRVFTDDFNFRTRFQFSMDIRTQTAYGTLRSYGRVMFTQTTPGDAPPGAASGWERAFIQFAGFTVGRAQSFFDIFTYGGAMSYHNVRPGGDTGAVGLTLWAYTAQFGNGVSATLSAEDPGGHNNMSVCDLSGTRLPPPLDPNTARVDNSCFRNAGITLDPQGGTNTGFHVPDIIGNVRVDQAWGYAGISAALHDVGAAYYGTPNAIRAGHPSNEWGWAVAAGMRLNVPGMPGDQFGVQATWAKGATGYNTNSSFWTIYNGSTDAGFGWATDGVFNTGTSIELTESWSVVAGYQHIWNPQWRTSWYGGYVEVDYNATATGWICATPTASSAIAAFNGNCNPDYSFYQLGSRTQWNPVPLLDIGLDVVYTKLNTAHAGATAAPTAPGRPAVLVADQEIWAAFFRIQRNWYP